jgi:hypothetical protein
MVSTSSEQPKSSDAINIKALRMHPLLAKAITSVSFTAGENRIICCGYKLNLYQIPEIKIVLDSCHIFMILISRMMPMTNSNNWTERESTIRITIQVKAIVKTLSIATARVFFTE